MEYVSGIMILGIRLDAEVHLFRSCEPKRNGFNGIPEYKTCPNALDSLRNRIVSLTYGAVHSACNCDIVLYNHHACNVYVAAHHFLASQTAGGITLKRISETSFFFFFSALHLFWQCEQLCRFLPWMQMPWLKRDKMTHKEDGR